MALELESPTFEAQATIPTKYTCDGPDVSPPLSWNDPPKGTKSFTIICDDPDAPGGTWVHWVLYDLPPDASGLPEDVPKTKTLDNGAKQGTNDFRSIGYGGPCPPRGPAHRYFFKLYALDAKLDLPPGKTKRDVEKAIEGHILASAALVGLYKR
ncbi:MAG TPA: YbhB/YbcL family Raf kinase inhibitor-like protein [Candidatus Avalokitesvara rifleensis]|uniref:YbhB/YbcL family Raf kinase inhibitor-like protein n=1 Tax=Candidatus Avalokitesvara rifleensis TaxID=3367620 RepID=UPI00271396C1|nr:YbhB/YbcL family Raf kinase inhibitor-like protein [Candidatus Brocadiales bacterium]